MNVKVIGCSTCWTDRPASSYCVNNTTLVDCGEGTLKYYKQAKVDFLEIKNIFITHLHGDHIFALYNYLSQHITYNPIEKRKSLTIYGPVGLKDAIQAMLNHFAPEVRSYDVEDYVNIVEIEDFSKVIEIDDMKVQLVKLKHGQLQNIAYVFNDGLVSVGFSGDCTYNEGVEQFVSLCDAAFLECCSEKTSENHLGYDDYIKICKTNPEKKFYAIHCVDRIYNNAQELGITVAVAGQELNF